MRNHRRPAALGGVVLAALSAAALTGCSGDAGGGEDGAPAVATKVSMITHAGDGDTFWTIVENGAKAAAEAQDADLTYQASGGDVQRQVQMMTAAIAEDPDAIVVSLTNPDAFAPVIQQARDAGISVFSVNSGTTDYAEAGSQGHVGEDEFVAGQGVGEQYTEAGVTNMVCVVHEQGNIGLENYCSGIDDSFDGGFETMYVTGSADVAASVASIQAKLEADSSIDGVFVLSADVAPNAASAVAASGKDLVWGTWGTTPDVLDAIESGDLLFTEDQQPWLQGYLAVTSAVLNAQYSFAPGAPVLTGPNFVTADQVPLLRELVGESIR
jgi:simple sugar transport system substrate-binding protein